MGIDTCEQGSVVVSLRTVTGIDGDSDQQALEALQKEIRTATEEDLCVSQGRYFIPVDGQAIKDKRNEVKDLIGVESELQTAITKNQGDIEGYRLELERLKPPSTLSTLRRGGQGFLGGVASAWALFGIGVPLVKRFYSQSCDDGGWRVGWKNPLAPVISMAVFTGGLWVVDHVVPEEAPVISLSGAENTSDPFASIPTNPDDLWKFQVKLDTDIHGPGGLLSQRILTDRESERFNKQLTPLRQSWANASWFTHNAPELLGGSAGTVFGFATTEYIERQFFKQLENRGFLKPCRVVPEPKTDPVTVDAPAERRVFEFDGKPVTISLDYLPEVPWYAKAWDSVADFNRRHTIDIRNGLIAATAVSAVATGVLVADDVTVVGVADDVAVPFTAAGTVVAGGLALLFGASVSDITARVGNAADAI